MHRTIIDRLLAGRRHRIGRRFDRKHGVETTDPIDRNGLTGMAPELREHAGEYMPTPVALFRRIIGKSRIDPADFSFVDLGSGKGRVLLAAAEYPFRSILGIEADGSLHQLAMQNLAGRLDGVAGSPMKILHADARTAELPKGNLFVFMYSPFRGPIFRQVASRLAEVGRESGRAVVIAYSADWEAEELERTRVFTRIRMPRRQFWAPPTVSLFYNDVALGMRR